MKRLNLQKVMAIVVAITLSGCTTFSNMETGLNSLVGQPLSAAINKIGYPSGQMQVGEDTVYTWGRRFSIDMPRYNQAQTTGQIGGTGFSANTGYTSYQTMDYECNVKIVTNKDQTIKTWEFDGNIGGCEAYSSRLKVKK